MATPLMAPLILFFLLLSMATRSNAAYCLCKDGVGDQYLQKNIDFACASGADCTPILQNGACYNPNTVKDHCNWAVNSYYQRKAQSGATCDFQGTATTSSNPPTTASTCPYQSAAGNAGTGTTPTTGTPPTGTGSGTGTSTGTGIGTPGMGTGTPGTATGTPGMGTGTPGMGTTIPGTNPGIGLAPTGTGFGSTDSSKASVTFQRASGLLLSTCLTLLVSGSGLRL